MESWITLFSPYALRSASCFFLWYLMSFFIYGYFGIIYQWINYDFDETPEQVQKHINDTISAGLRQNP